MRHLCEQRQKLLTASSEFLEALLKRKSLAAQIVSTKTELSLPAYDPDRELHLFFELSHKLEQLTLSELMAFSLVMESQAGESYPRWSSGAHLSGERIERNLENQFLKMNPLLLLLFYPKLIKVEFLRPDFRFLIELAGEKRSK